MLISKEYLALQQNLYSRTGDYGRSGEKWIKDVIEIANACQARTILDYGCGRGSLVYALGVTDFEAHGYDPCISDKAKLPDPADLVVCTDVMEHVEIECLDAVLEHMWSLTRRRLFVVVSTRPAGKRLADGRNAHITLLEGKVWQRKFKAWFNVVRIIKFDKDEWTAELSPRETKL